MSNDKTIKLNFNGKEIGKALVRDYGDGEVFLTDFVINKEYRGQGFGKKALKYLMDKYGVNSLTVGVSNDIAMNLYKDFDFKIVQGPYYDNNANENVYYMKHSSLINKEDTEDNEEN